MATTKRPTRKPKGKLDVLPGTDWDEYALPHIGVLALLIIALVIRAKLADPINRLPLSLGVLASSSVISWCVYRYAKARDDFQQIHATITPLLGGMGFAITLLVGNPGWWLWTYALAGVTLGLTWNVRNAKVVKGEGKDDHPQAKGWDEIHGIPGSRPRVVSEDEDSRRIRIRLTGGQNRDDLAKAAKSIEAATGGQMGSARLVPPPSGRADEGDLILMKKDVLKAPLRRPQWDGKRRSISEGLRPGRFESGDITVIAVAGGTDAASPANLQVMGASRSGKSHLFRLAVLDIAETDDCVLWASDTIKGRQTIGPLLPAIDWFASTKAETFQMFAAVDRAIRYRADWLGERGLDEWRPGCGLPLLKVWVEEAARVVGDSDRFTRLCESALSAGVIIVNSMQRASYDNLPTSARANIAAAMCFAVQAATDAGFILPDHVMDSAVPHLWYSNLPEWRGYYYAVAPGITAEQQVMPGRTWGQDHDGTRLTASLITRLIAERAPGMARLDEGTAAAAGQAYADRTKPGQPGGPPVDPAAAGIDLDLDEEMDDLLDDLMDDEELDVPTPDPDDAADLDGIDPRATLPIPGGNRALGPVGTPGPDLTGRQRHLAWLHTIDEVAARKKPDRDGSVVVTLEELQNEWFSVPGISASTRPWLHARLGALIGDELAERVGRGAYRLTPNLLRQVGAGTIPITEGDIDAESVSPASGGPPA